MWGPKTHLIQNTRWKRGETFPPPPPLFWPKFKVKEGRILSFYLPPSFFSKLLVFFKFLPHSFFFFTKNSFSCVFLLKFQPTIDGFDFFLKVKYGKE
jgi:hypothetical protein